MMKITSGSVAGPTLVSEMLSRKIPTIVVCIGNTSSRIETENTSKTLKGYEVIAKKRDMPVIMAYKENSTDNPRAKVDNDIQTLIVLLTVIFSGDNKELDGSDLRNFLDYTKVTTFNAKLCFFDLFSEKIELSRDQNLVTLVTLVDDETPSEVDVLNEYQAVGYIHDEAKKNMTIPLPIHAAIIDGHFPSVLNKLEGRLNVYKEMEGARVTKTILSGNESATDEGLIL